MAEYTVNRRAITHARALIIAGQVVLRSDWGEVRPTATRENEFLEDHTWGEFGAWHLGLVVGATPRTKSRYGFGFGDFEKVHRAGLLACQYRAAEWRHRDLEGAVTKLLRYLDRHADK